VPEALMVSALADKFHENPGRFTVVGIELFAMTWL
jgi:hypothetical protein